MARVDYHTYIESDEWKFKAKAMRWIAGNRCQVCNSSGKRLDTHHRTYDNLGNETPSDLIVLCEDCHEMYHETSKQVKFERTLDLFGVERMEKYLEEIKNANTFMLGEIDKAMHGKQVNVVGVVTSIQPRRSQAGNPMAFVRIVDIQAEREVIVFPRTYDTYRSLLTEGHLILVRGKVDAQGSHPKILADTISNELSSYAT